MSRCLALLLASWPLLAATPVLRVQLRTQHGARIVELPLERYVAAALAGESSVFQSAEALKAMAVAARTYAIQMRGRHSSEGFDFCDTTHCQRIDPEAVTARLESAAAETAGEMLWFQGKLAFTPYTRDCGGRTEDVSAVWPDQAAPYLKSRADDYCVRAGTLPWHWTASAREIVEALRRSELRTPATLDRLSILDRTGSGRAATLVLDGAGSSVRISASSFRFAIGRELGWNTLRGDRFEVRASNGRITFDGTGSGHGVGLCQLGAEQMGLAGRSYREILAFYYRGTVPGVTARGLTWQRLSGEGLSLLTMRPDEDRAALGIAERQARNAAQRTGWPVPANLELRVYPDLDAFRDSTGEPGWVAAHTAGRRMHLQPVSVLRARGVLESTIAHEVWHVVLESQAATGLPLWFREGLAGFLASGRGSGPTRIPADSELRAMNSADEARKAYAGATAAVANLVDRYGETAVLSWVKRGLPPDVTKASTSQATTKSR